MTGFAQFIQDMRGAPEDRPDALTRAMQAPDGRDPEPPDEDERQSALLARHYAPGAVTDLARRYADTMSELATVQEANEASRKRQERIARDHAAGRISAFDIMAMDTAEPDVAREQQLERRAESLRGQLAGASALIAREPARAPDEFAAVNRTAHALFTATTRQRMAEAQARRTAPRPERRPFASRGSVAIRSENCFYCTQEGLDDDTAFLIHSDPQYPLPTTSAEQAALAAQYEQEQAEQAPGRSAYPPGAVITTGHREISRGGG
jgi:hypothetical protein